MLSSWVLVLAVLGGACALPAPAPLTYTQALAQAVDSFNQRPEVQNTFRMLSADPEPTPDVQLGSLQRLNFTIMETRCPAHSGARLDACEFKEDGMRAEGGGVSWRGGSPAWGRSHPRVPTLSPPLSAGHQGLLRARAAARQPPRVRRRLRGLHRGSHLGQALLAAAEGGHQDGGCRHQPLQGHCEEMRPPRGASTLGTPPSTPPSPNKAASRPSCCLLLLLSPTGDWGRGAWDGGDADGGGSWGGEIGVSTLGWALPAPWGLILAPASCGDLCPWDWVPHCSPRHLGDQRVPRASCGVPMGVRVGHKPVGPLARCGAGGDRRGHPQGPTGPPEPGLQP
ncbi:uncharacterized protein ACIBXB_011428 isoform 1-T1 [Morphnus guianensis]